MVGAFIATFYLKVNVMYIILVWTYWTVKVLLGSKMLKKGGDIK